MCNILEVVDAAELIVNNIKGYLCKYPFSIISPFNSPSLRQTADCA